MKNLFIQEKKLLRAVKDINYKNLKKSNVSIGIIPTFDCNLRCVYCYAKGGDTKEYISLEVAKIAINEISKSCAKDHIDLYLVGGGEPLLNFSLISDIVDFTKNLYNSVGIHVVSNGAFEENVLLWLIKNKVNTRISYDGVMHEHQRPFFNGNSSKDLVEQNIKRLIEADLNPIIQCIITKNGVNTICETIDNVISLGVKNIKIEPALSTNVSRGGVELEPDPELYAHNLLKAIKYIANHRLNLKIDTGYFSEPSLNHYCGISNSNKIVTPQGFITACVEVSRMSDSYSEKIIYGKITTDGIRLDEEKQKELRFLHYSNQMGGCNECNLRLICLGGCPMNNIWDSGLPYKKSKFTCVVEHTLIPLLLMEIAENSKIADVILNKDAKITSC